MTAKILVVDDHELVRVGIAQLIRRQPGWEVCGEAGDAQTGIRLVRETSPDLVLVDLRLKEGDGLELLKQLKAACPAVKTLVLSMQDERLYAERSIRAGARGFISKQEPAQQLLTAIRQVLEGKIYLSPAMTELTVSKMAGGAEPEQSSIAQLSDREMEVFELLGQGKTVKQISLLLHLSPKTVEYHRQRIKEKLRVDSTQSLLRHATVHVIQQG